MALYPDVSPSAPVSRDDLAAILALQQMQAQGVGYGGNVGQTTNQGSQSFGDMLGGQPGGFMSGAPPGGSILGGDRSSSLADPSLGRDALADTVAAPGAMTTSNAAMITDTTNTNRDTINPFSEDALGDRASQSFNSFSNASPVATPASAGFPGWGGPGGPFGGRGGQGREGFGDQQTSNAVTTSPFSSGNLPEFGWGGGRGRDSAAMTGIFDPSMTRDEASDKDPFGDKSDPLSMTDDAATQGRGPTMIGTVTPSGYTGRGAVGDPGDPGNTPSDPGNSGFSAAGFSGPGGFGAFGGGAATGGYEGSASMSNTGGAQGFEGVGGAPGTGGAGVGGMSAGGDPGGGAVGGFGGGESGGSSPGSGADPGGGVG